MQSCSRLLQGKTPDTKKPKEQSPKEAAKELEQLREQNNQLTANLSLAAQELAATIDYAKRLKAEKAHLQVMKAVVEKEQHIAWLQTSVDPTSRFQWKVWPRSFPAIYFSSASMPSYAALSQMAMDFVAAE